MCASSAFVGVATKFGTWSVIAVLGSDICRCVFTVQEFNA